MIFSFSSLRAGDKVAFGDNRYLVDKFLYPPDSTLTADSTKVMPFPLEEETFPYTGDENENGLFLSEPSIITEEVNYDPETGLYKIEYKLGDIQYRPPKYMILDEYREYDLKNSVNKYWKERSLASGMGTRGGIIPSIYIGGKAFDRVFGGNTVDIRPAGDVDLFFGIISTYRDDPNIDENQRRQTNFDFDMGINMSVTANIGEKISFTTNYNTEATFDFENKLKLGYEGDEDEIIQLIEAGNVSLPLTGSLITGSQGLFGIKTKLKFGRTTVTTIFSEQETESRNVSVEGGGMHTDFLIYADEYEENKYFFLSHFFRENYEEALQDLPIINSGINIIKLEVWVTNIGAAVTENRNIIAFTDLGENDPENILNDDVIHPNLNGNSFFPDDKSNDLFEKVNRGSIRNLNNANNYLTNIGLVPSSDFEKIELAKKLTPNDYSINTKLGFISLNFPVNSDQALAVAFQYQVLGQDSVFQVGEFSDQGIVGEDALVTKLIRGTYIDVRSPIWDLMMKNVYSLNAMMVNSDDFTLNILYEGDDNGIPTGYFSEGPFAGDPLLQVFNLDNLDQAGNQTADGMFDFIDGANINGGTINANKGKIFFTVLEPFGSYLRKKLGDDNVELADRYCFDSLYTLTKTGAEQYAEKNKFLLSGYYKSQGGSDISLNAMNIPRGSVRVTAGGVELVENVDYTVDYTLGRVRIINDGIMNSGTPINVSLESQNLLGLQTKRLMGTHVDYDFNENFHLGATAMNLSEKPITQKVSYGNDPISNTIWGMDYSYMTDSRLITKIVDKIPFYSSAQESQIILDGEFAHFIPGHNKSVGKEGTSYIDDFEGTKSTIDLKMPYNWFLASTPQYQNDLFPEAQSNDLSYGYNRANISWYTIDPTVFYSKSNNIRPENIDQQDISNHYARQVLQDELFPDRDIDPGQPTNLSVLNIAFYPEERGAYNYDVEPSPYSAGISPDGLLNDPMSRWGGMMRELQTTDFEATNVEYIEFWMMDPFLEGTLNEGNGGDLYFNLGDVSEDILKDSRKSFEHGLPIYDTISVDDYDTTQWGVVPDKLDIVQSFSNQTGSRQYQDVGYDGLNDIDEQGFFASENPNEIGSDYLIKIANTFGDGSNAYIEAINDPSGDNYHHFRGEDYDADDEYSDVNKRYKRFSGVDGNSPEDDGSNYFAGNSRTPNVEDLNQDNTLNEAERYYQYKVHISNNMVEGENYITDVHEGFAMLPNGETETVKWYQFKIPIRRPDKVVGNISDFKSIRFMRMFMKDFSSPIILRFATLDLVRGEWRTYPHSEDLIAPGEYVPSSTSNNTSFEISAVSVEENGTKEPYPYVIPPGIEREMNIGVNNLRLDNEQAMVMKVCDLIDGDVVAAYKTAEFDFRQFNRLRMFVHAEEIGDVDYKPGDLTIFMRIGSDFTQNYYEYEIPLTFTKGNTSLPTDIWPSENEFDILLDSLVAVKHKRNLRLRDPNSLVRLNFPFYSYEGENRITVLGNPSISDVKSIMIGLRNPRAVHADDDGAPRCAEIWVNELRLSDFNKQSGFAARSSIAMNLADLGSVTISGIYSSPWFASIDQQITEIPLEGMSQFDVATNIDLGKLFPKNAGLSIPMHYDYSQTRLAPKYNPLDPDITMATVLNSYQTPEERDTFKLLTQDITTRKNLNFMNVRKNKVTGQNRRSGPPMGMNGKDKDPDGDKKGKKDRKNKNHFYDLSNLSASYSYNEISHSNMDIEYDIQKNYLGSLGYSYNFNSKPITPFENIEFFKKNKAFQIIKDFNFNLLPKMISYNTDMNRMYATDKLRNKSFGDIIIPARFNKTWDWQRNFSLKFDITKALVFDFSSNTMTFIREYPGSNKEEFSGSFNGEELNVMPEEKQQLVSDELKKGGSRKNYSHNASLNYTLPINKIPLFDWISIQAGYQAQYQWAAAPLAYRDELGSTIANNRNYNINGNADFTKFYKKFGFLKKLDQKSRVKNNKNNTGKKGSETKKDDNKNGAEADSLNQNKIRINYFKIAYESALRIITGVKKFNFQYSVNDGTTLPGFTREPSYLGNDWDTRMPGLPFLFGDQPSDPGEFRDFISTSENLNSQYLKQHNENFSARLTVEPFKDFKIELSAERSYASNFQSYFLYDTAFNDVIESNRVEQGSFSMTFITWGTAFGGDLDGDRSQYFEDFKDYRFDIANEIANRDPRNIPINDTTGFPQGYGPTSQRVMLPAFISAYTGRGIEESNYDITKAIPLPNWRISYKGLTKIDLFKRYFKNFTINHQYQSSFNIGSYYSNVNYSEEEFNGVFVPASKSINPVTGNFYSKYDFGMVMINESFSPLLSLDMTMQNRLQFKVELKKNRSLAMSFANNQLTEQKNDDYVVGLGYIFEDVPLRISTAGGSSKRTFKSDLNIKVNFSFRDSKTVLRNIDTDLNQISTGDKLIKIDVFADYQFSKSLTARIEFVRDTRIPALPTSYRTADTRGGIRLIYSLAQ